ncbi:pyruvyltransferase [Methylophaga frappieri]|uniref:Pyruvyltransferase n=1 Tax=Methylophaga frappieri (strain ATCC BAA-2434 / DSM 25690 / JAM7) TaxID=754477 RepID=I1YKE4_METFJ|nr:pyruvyltransferase [Methylophaga frappieri]
MIAIGSLLHRLPEHWFSRRLSVWGSGFIEAKKPHQSRHHYHAIRGALSRDIISAGPDTPLGDPGLLAHLLLSGSKPTKKFTVGLVAHYKDKSHPLLAQLCDRYADVTLIDIFLPPAMFLQRLQTCEVIFSSAMHGLIAADALGIANARIQLSNDLRGGDFKFADYYTNFGISAAPIALTVDEIHHQAEHIVNSYHRPGLTEIQSQLIAAFPSF